MRFYIGVLLLGKYNVAPYTEKPNFTCGVFPGSLTLQGGSSGTIKLHSSGAFHDARLRRRFEFVRVGLVVEGLQIAGIVPLE